MAQDTLSFGGVSADEVYANIVKAGVSSYDAKQIAAGWILENLGKSKRVFSYAETFPAADPTCQPPAFVRQFVHADWVDGEDVVQAGTTPGEDGFNQRFHKIEGDLDQLGDKVATLTACLAAMRASLRKLLDELRNEINRINSDVFECCQKGAPTTPGGLLPRFPGLIDIGHYMGTSKFFDKNISVWQTKQGMIMLPAIETLGLEVVTGGRARAAGYVAKFIEEEPQVKQRFPAQVQLAELIKAFGDAKLADGRSLYEASRILPLGSKFRDLGAMVEEIATREAATLRTLEGADAAIAVAIGVDAARESAADAQVEKLTGIPSQARSALMRSGIGTVAKLAASSSADVAKIMRDSGVKVAAGDSAAWIADAKTLVRIADK